MNSLSVFSGTIVAGGVAALVNLALLFGGKPLVGAPESFSPLSVVPVLIATMAACLGAGIVFAILRRVSAHADTTFTMIAFVLLVLSFVPDLMLRQLTTGIFAGATWGTVVLLMLMHVVAAGTVLLVFLNAVRPASA